MVVSYLNILPCVAFAGVMSLSVSCNSALGAQAGVAVKPGTPADGLLPLLDEADIALVMTVEPGFGGAAFLPAMLPKVAAVRRAIGERACRLQVDGGINLETAAAAAAAGADVLIAGHGVFAAADVAGTIRALRAKAQEAQEGTCP